MNEDQRIFKLGERITIRLNDKTVVVEVDGELQVSTSQTHQPQGFGAPANDESDLCAIRGLVEYFGATTSQSLEVEVRLGERDVHTMQVFRDKPYVDDRKCLRFVEVESTAAEA